MAYSKQTWVDNVSAANAERLTHMEDGIAAAEQEAADAAQGAADAAAAVTTAVTGLINGASSGRDTLKELSDVIDTKATQSVNPSDTSGLAENTVIFYT